MSDPLGTPSGRLAMYTLRALCDRRVTLHGPTAQQGTSTRARGGKRGGKGDTHTPIRPHARHVEAPAGTRASTLSHGRARLHEENLALEPPP
eukprot:6085448-Alexandrium_andersonii.AAC.1